MSSRMRDNKEVLLQRESLLNCIGEGVYGVDLEGKCFFINPAALTMLGLQEEDVLHKSIGETISMGAHETCDWLYRSNGEKFPAKIIATPIYIESQLHGTAVAFMDISAEYEAQQELRKLNKILQLQAITDPLTQVYNQRYFKHSGMEWFERAKNEQISLSVLAPEIDNFKHIKKEHGTEVCDLLIKMVAQVVKSKVKDEEILARVGCEEFSIIVPHAKLQESSELATEIIKEVRTRSVFVDGVNISCSVSVGLVHYSKLFARFIEMLKALEVKLYLAQESGGNCLKM
jgi:diguanylate cyclase (GGDEF)-like protein